MVVPQGALVPQPFLTLSPQHALQRPKGPPCLHRSGRMSTCLHAKQVAHLEEESVVRPVETGAQRIVGVDRVAQGTAVAGEEYGAGIRLVGEQ